MGDEEREDEALDREEVSEDTTSETDTEAVEQRTDDYDGLARRLDDIYDLISSRFDAMQESLDALGVATVEGTGTVDAGDAAEQVIDEILGIDSLDLL